MDELWQRYRTFWTPVLIGIGVFLVGVIAVHVASPDPDQAKRRMEKEASLLERAVIPDPAKTTTLRRNAEILETDVEGDARKPRTPGWAERLAQAEPDAGRAMAQAAEQALRAAILRGAPDDPDDPGAGTGGPGGPAGLAARFEDDEVAAAKAYRRFRERLGRHAAALVAQDPNVAFSALLHDVWSDLRVRANRADVEIGPSAQQLGFGVIGSVSRATLPGRVLTLALVARIADIAVREGAVRIDAVQIPAIVEPGDPTEFLVLWPVDVTVTGDAAVVKRILDMLTDPAAPVPIEAAQIEREARRGTADPGQVRFSVRVASALVRPSADLDLDVEEEQ